MSAFKRAWVSLLWRKHSDKSAVCAALTSQDCRNFSAALSTTCWSRCIRSFAVSASCAAVEVKRFILASNAAQRSSNVDSIALSLASNRKVEASCPNQGGSSWLQPRLLLPLVARLSEEQNEASVEEPSEPACWACCSTSGVNRLEIGDMAKLDSSHLSR